MTKISPSLLAADFMHMERDIKMIESAGADYLHCDVMDGMFVPNMSFGQPVVKSIASVASVPLDVHLMVESPERYIKDFADMGADIITVHVEATCHLQRALSMIRGLGKRAGAVLNPATPLDALDYVLDDVDMVLLMSVNPGFGGQSFVPAVLGKITRLREMIDQSGNNIELEVDGGIAPENAAGIRAAGADVLVAGSSIFGAADPAAALRAIRG